MGGYLHLLWHFNLAVWRLPASFSQEASRCGTRIGTQYTLALMPVHALWLSEGLGYSWKAKRCGLKT